MESIIVTEQGYKVRLVCRHFVGEWDGVEMYEILSGLRKGKFTVSFIIDGKIRIAHTGQQGMAEDKFAEFLEMMAE